MKNTDFNSKTVSLLRFLEAVTNLRRKRIAAYGVEDRLLWLADLPGDLHQNLRDAYRSPFKADNPADISDFWLEVRKKPKPTLATLPRELRDWVPQKFQDNPDEYLDKTTDQLLDLLNPEITVLDDKRALDPDAPSWEGRTLVEKEPEVRHLEDYPEVQEAWFEYLQNQWQRWAEETRCWQKIQRLYEDVDFMRRRLEEAEERYELLLAIGLLQWRDSTGSIVKRHLLTAPAEIDLDAVRGVLTVGPAASFEQFRLELDMLELQDRPRLEENDLQDRLEELDVRAWDKASVVEILRIIANKASAKAEVDEDTWKPLERTDETFRIIYAPALVLRGRRPTAYEELINSFLEASKGGEAFSTTAPWNRFVSEGAAPSGPPDRGPEAGFVLNDAGGLLYFPLPTNEEQQQIIERLKTRPYVLVKGPPGTGKSHTIANLICHLLATGERVLVTAHAPKALTVLRDLLPSDLRNLCVTAFGSTREDHRLLEDSVRGILTQKDNWKETESADQIDQLEKQLLQINNAIVQTDRKLRAFREDEIHSRALPGGYHGTAAQIARQLQNEQETFDWFPDLGDSQATCPLKPDEIAFLADVHGTLTEAHMAEIELQIGDSSLPQPEEFEKAIEALNVARAEAEAARAGVPDAQLAELQRRTEADLEACRAFLSQLDQLVTRASRVLGDMTPEILKDLLVGQNARWDRLEWEVTELAKQIQAARDRAGSEPIEVPSEIDNIKLFADTRRRLEHFRNGGWRGWGFFVPRVVRETRYIEERCRVNGEAPRDKNSLDMLLGFLELMELLKRFQEVWPGALNSGTGDPRHTALEVSVLVDEFCRLLEFFKTAARSALDVVPIEKRVMLSEGDERATWRRSIETELARRRVDHAQAPLEAWRKAIQEVSHHCHPCLAELAKAIEDRDPVRWRAVWDTRERLEREKGRLHRYQALLNQIRQTCPQLATLLQSTQGDPEWSERLRQLGQAWAWAAARVCLRKVTNSEIYEQLTNERRRLQAEKEKKIEKLAALKAWQAFFARLDDQTNQKLTAWTKAVARIGKGTGKYAYRHRRTARQYLMACIPKMPAWVMPLHKLWETVEPIPGLFDTVIVDEASQAGIEALALLLLAKRIIVVGDDKQNSPEAVGILEDDIARLARDYLREFQFRDEFRPDTSFYDHAERAFGNVISLREHFRCVPEIIRFSNDLCYTDAPLIPLRQPPLNRLEPLKTTFVDTGACEGEGQRILNRSEAEAIVERILGCLGDKAYEGKTMGVIVLQGHAQAEYIEMRLAEVLEPKVREERKLRCGVPATFQGDERDVIFLSLVAAPNRQFRALTALPDQRRFNVAMSRARDQVWLFHSVQPSDLNREDLRWRLLNFFGTAGQGVLEGLYEELDRLEREANRSHRQLGEQPKPYESWFEVDVALELLRRNYRLRPQVDVAGYRIDLVVEGLVNRLAVECDGECWHGPERFDYDMARQRQLERAGWTFVRVRESEFYADRNGAVNRILKACEKLHITPLREQKLETYEEPTASASAGEVLDDEEEPSDVVESEGAERTEEERLEESGPARLPAYSEEANFPDPRSGSPSDVRAALRRIISEKGPLTKHLLLRLYVEGCPDLQRAGKTVRRSLNGALNSMQRCGEIVVEDELGDRSLESQVLRLAGAPKVRVRSAEERDLLEIPPSELFLALDQISVATVDADNQTLIRKLFELYGFRRLTKQRQRHMDKVLNKWRERREKNW